MNVCIIGSGAREHSLAKKFSEDKTVNKVIVIPGNIGMIDQKKISIKDVRLDNIDKLSSLLKSENVDLTVIGPEKYLDEGLSDKLQKLNHNVLGASQSSSKLESSKIYSKQVMNKFNIPTAKYISFDDYYAAIDYLNEWDMSSGIVIKADGLSSGKGVVVTFDKNVAKETIFDFMKNPKCTVKAKEIIFEECLKGQEVSTFAVCDGEDFHILGHVTDYKRVYDNDKGPNTGGMGTFSSPEWPPENIKRKIKDQIFSPLIEGLKKEGKPFKGILFAGIMIKNSEINVIEFNVRFGDPETQVLLPLLKGNFSNVMLNAAKGTLKESTALTHSLNSAVHIVMCSSNYPSIDGTKLGIGYPIQIDQDVNQHVVYGGVGQNEEGNLINTGGRVLGVTSLATTLVEARVEAYEMISKIKFTGAHWRKDIAKIN